MADNLQRYGFRVCQGRHAPHENPIKKKVASGYQATTADLHIGDPVSLVSDGTVALAAAGSGLIYGVITQILPYWDGTKMVFNDRLPGGTAPGTTIVDRFSYVMVQRAFGTIFEVDVDDAVTATTLAAYQAFIEENCDHAFSVDATAKKSFPRLDISTHAVTATLQWRIVGISETGDNRDYSGAYVKLLVQANVVSEGGVVALGV
jgi:hypothetical protein